MPEHHLRLPPRQILDRRTAAHELPLVDRLRDPALRAGHRAAPDANVSDDAHLPSHDDVVFDHRAAGDPDLRGQQHAPPDRDAVRDVDQVVELAAGADARFADRRPINRRVRADLDVVFDDDVGVLRNLDVRAVGLLREAIAVAADHHAVLQHDAVPRGPRARGCRPASG